MYIRERNTEKSGGKERTCCVLVPNVGVKWPLNLRIVSVSCITVWRLFLGPPKKYLR